MSRYNIFQAIFMSFYSKALYRDVARNWHGKTFLYLFVLLALSWILFVYQLQQGLSLWYKKNSDRIINQVPVLTIKDGKLSTPENRPYIIHDPDTNETIGIIDTTGQYTVNQNIPILVTTDSVITHPKPNQTRIDKIPENLSITLHPDLANQYIKDYLGYAWLLLFFPLLIVSYLYRLIQALIYALIGKVYCSILRVPLTYGQVILLSMVAVTPAIVIATFLDFFAITFPNITLCYLVLSLAYLFYAVFANKEEP